MIVSSSFLSIAIGSGNSNMLFNSDFVDLVDILKTDWLFSLVNVVILVTTIATSLFKSFD